MVHRGNRLCPSGSILLSTHYDPLFSHPTARRVLERFFPECSAAPEGEAKKALLGNCVRRRLSRSLARLAFYQGCIGVRSVLTVQSMKTSFRIERVVFCCRLRTFVEPEWSVSVWIQFYSIRSSNALEHD